MRKRRINTVIPKVATSVAAKRIPRSIYVLSFLDRLHRDGKLAWANSIIYDYKAQIAAGHSDDTSLLGHPELGWGWLVDRGFDIIQTDWAMMMIKYLKSVNKYYR